ncbi:hypothetical protein EYF80_002259 [Liparis tanakae]|uniref:Uncharacterized protein n=1 Tax=Liparis tanakae TaxID=230148 RepID=A0A4Z2JE74_9TELE|nr:hypothetical protein EYF80_002259 [Liparis tanakae]
MEGVLRGVLRGVWDDRLGRPTQERFHKSRVSEHGWLRGNPENLNEAHHLLAERGYCCLLTTNECVVPCSGPDKDR